MKGFLQMSRATDAEGLESCHVICPGTEQVWALPEVLNACLEDHSNVWRQEEVQRERIVEVSAICKNADAYRITSLSCGL